MSLILMGRRRGTTGASTILNPNPTALSVAAGQDKDLTAYTALAVSGLSAGQSYTDPASGLRVWKVTSATVPDNTTAQKYATHHYSEGAAHISQEWAPGWHTLFVRGLAGSGWLVDHQRGVGLSNWRAAPVNTELFTFARNASTPDLAFFVNGSNQIVRYNHRTNSTANTGAFPKALGGTVNTWFQQDRADDWFVALNNSTDVAYAWRSSTDTLISQTFAGIDDLYLDKDGGFAMPLTGQSSSSLWNLNANTVGTISTTGNGRFIHVGFVRRYAALQDVITGGGNTPLHRVDTANPTGSTVYDTLSGYAPDAHNSGGWIQPNADTTQWVLRSTYSWSGAPVADGGSWANGTEVIHNGISLHRLDGTDMRFVCHHYSENDDKTAPYTPSGGSDGYWSIPRAQISPSGKLVVFDSNMNNSSRSDVFCVELPEV